LLAVAAVAGCGGGGPRSNHGGMGRLYGTVTRGPTTPVCQEGTPCSRPASGARLVFTTPGGVARSVVVAKDGSYSVWLRGGTYNVSASPQPSVGRGLEPGTVRVDGGHARTVDFSIDTGIR
jgi:hypothetical protein